MKTKKTGSEPRWFFCKRCLLPDGFEQLDLDRRVRELRECIHKEAHANAVGRSAALVCVEFVERIAFYWDLLEAAFVLELHDSDQSLEQNFRQIKTRLRTFEQLTRMLLGQVDRLLKCVGGPQAIAVQQLLDWAQGDASRQQFLVQTFAASIKLAKRTRQKKPGQAEQGGDQSDGHFEG